MEPQPAGPGANFLTPSLFEALEFANRNQVLVRSQARCMLLFQANKKGEGGKDLTSNTMECVRVMRQPAMLQQNKKGKQRGCLGRVFFL